MVQEELSKEDQARIKSCDNVKMAKQIMKSHESWKNLELGEVFFLKKKTYNGNYQYVSRTWDGDRDKFVVFHKDEDGFVYIKRINATGTLGKEVRCLTSEFYNCEIEPDPDFVDSIIFEQGENYDPLAMQKDITKKKSKARRKNNKLKITFKTGAEAYAYVKTLSKGDKLYTMRTQYGSGITEWTIDKIIKRKTDRTPQRWGGPGNTRIDREHNEHNFNMVYDILAKVSDVGKNSRYTQNSKSNIDFTDFIGSWCRYYKSKPYSVDDF